MDLIFACIVPINSATLLIGLGMAPYCRVLCLENHEATVSHISGKSEMRTYAPKSEK